MENKIPKIIHYCWFGKNPKPDLVLKCIGSWKNIMPDYEIKEWNEENFNINDFEYTRLAYQNKKWAFVSDFVRLKALYENGGIYLDTDMYVLKSFDDFIENNYELILGKEDEENISAGMIACNKNNIYIKMLIEYYEKELNREPIPKIMTKIFNNYIKIENIININTIKIFESINFYPFDANNISKFNYNNAPKESYAVHLWNYSWGHPLNKIIKKIGLYKNIKIITEKLGIKNKIKKILKME